MLSAHVVCASGFLTLSYHATHFAISFVTVSPYRTLPFVSVSPYKTLSYLRHTLYLSWCFFVNCF